MYDMLLSLKFAYIIAIPGLFAVLHCYLIFYLLKTYRTIIIIYLLKTYRTIVINTSILFCMAEKSAPKANHP